LEKIQEETAEREAAMVTAATQTEEAAGVEPPQGDWLDRLECALLGVRLRKGAPLVGATRGQVRQTERGATYSPADGAADALLWRADGGREY